MIDVVKLRSDEDRRKIEIEKKVDEYIRIADEVAEKKRRMDELKGWFEAQGLQDLNATKDKTVDYWGGAGKIEVGRSETVSAVALALLKKLFGKEVFEELIRPKYTLEMTAPCKHLLGQIFLGNYIKTPLEDIITAAVPDDEKRQAALRKKLRGNFRADKKALMQIAGKSEKDAEYYAYMAAESVVYDQFVRLLESGNWDKGLDEAVKVIRTAVLVTEGVSVTADAAK